jgi:hypothetical protein
LHTDTLLGLQAEFEAAFHLAFYVAELTGRSEAGEIDENNAHLLRLLTPIMKLTTGKQSVIVASEVLESFGGAGSVEDTGLPVLLRDSQVLPIWEGTTNVLALDALRAMGLAHATSDRLIAESGITPLRLFATELIQGVTDARLSNGVRVVRSAIEHAEHWLSEVQSNQDRLEAGARRLALTLGRAIELALLIRHAQWSQENERDGRATVSARRFAQYGIDLIVDEL